MEESLEFRELDRKKKCSECGEVKPLSLFNVTDSGKRRKPFCRQCELKSFIPKKAPKIVGQGRPIFGFGGSPLKVNELKEVGEVRIREEDEMRDIVKRNRKESRERVMKQRKTMRMSETMKKKLKKEEEARKVFDEVISQYIEMRGEGFKASDIRKFINKDLGKKEPTSQWVVGILRTLARLKILRVKSKRGGSNTYYLKKQKEGKDLKKALEERKERAKKEKKERIIDRVKLELEKVEVVELDKGKIPVREEEEDKIINKPFEPTKEEWRELMKNKEKILKDEGEDRGCDDDFLRGISTIADEVHINFVTRETEVILSPNGNLLRVYDLLSKKQKETAEVDGKNLKFYW